MFTSSSHFRCLNVSKFVLSFGIFRNFLNAISDERLLVFSWGIGAGFMESLAAIGVGADGRLVSRRDD